MPRYAVRVEDRGREFWLEWSTVVDAPITYGMSRDEYREYVRDERGREGLERLDLRLATDWLPPLLADEYSGNRAGLNGSWLTLAQLVDHYCHGRPDEDQPDPDPPMGIRWFDAYEDDAARDRAKAEALDADRAAWARRQST